MIVVAGRLRVCAEDLLQSRSSGDPDASQQEAPELLFAEVRRYASRRSRPRARS